MRWLWQKCNVAQIAISTVLRRDIERLLLGEFLEILNKENSIKKELKSALLRKNHINDIND